MKCLNSISRAAAIAALMSLNVLFLNASDGDFGAWNTTADGHDGLWSSKIEFTEKNLTIEAWIYIDEQDGKNGSGTNIMSARHDGNTGFSISLNANANNENSVDVRFWFKTVYDAIYTFWIPREHFSNKWGHIAFVINSDTQRAMAYLNGALFGDPIENMDGEWKGNNTSDNGFWTARWWSDPKFYGKLAEIRIWNIPLLSSDIEENYNKLLKGDEEGLNIYYSFSHFAETVVNLAEPGRNDGSLKPAETWNTVHSFEVLSAMPVDVQAAANTASWSGTADNFDIEIIEKATGAVVKSDHVEANTYPLAGLGLDESKEYIVRVRAITNGFYSDWAVSELGGTGFADVHYADMLVYSENGSIIIHSETAQSVNIYTIDGKSRPVSLNAGKNIIADVAKGIYLINKQKVLVK